MTQQLHCSACEKLLAELNHEAITSHGFSIRVETNAFREDLAWAICERCGQETSFDATFLKVILKMKGRNGPAGSK